MIGREAGVGGEVGRGVGGGNGGEGWGGESVMVVVTMAV